MSTEPMEVVANPYEGLGFAESELEALSWNDDGSDPDEIVIEALEEPEVVEAEVVDEVTEAKEDLVEDVSVEEPEVVAERKPVLAEDLAFAPQFQAKGVEDFKGATAKLNGDYEALTDELATKYEAGDLSFSDYRKQERNITREYEAIKQELYEANLKADIAADYNKQSSAQKWELEQNLFYSDNADYKDDAILRGALSAQLNVLYDDTANQGKSGLWFLREAAKIIDTKFARTTPYAVSSEAKESLKQAEEAMSRRKANQPNIPKTLGGVPVAESNEEASNEFSYMDKLNGTAYETALSKMNESQRDRYMAA